MTSYRHEDWYDAERLHRAADEGDIKRLILAGYDVNLFDDIGRTPLHYAIVSGQVDAARIGDTPLAFAVQAESIESVRLLLASGADPDIDGWMGQTARSRACRRVDETGREMCRLISASSPKS